MTGRKGRLVRSAEGGGVVYEARNASGVAEGGRQSRQRGLGQTRGEGRRSGRGSGGSVYEAFTRRAAHVASQHVANNSWHRF